MSRSSAFSADDLLEKDEINPVDSIEHGRDDAGLSITKMLIHTPCSGIPRIGIHPEAGTAEAQRKTLIEADEFRTIAAACKLRSYDKGMEDKDTAIAVMVRPIPFHVCLRLDMVDDRGTDDRAMIFQDEEITALQCIFSRLPYRIHAAFPADGEPSRFLLRMDSIIDHGNGIDIIRKGLPDHPAKSSFAFAAKRCPKMRKIPRHSS